MQTLNGMLAQTIHEDRLRGYDDRTLRHSAALREGGAGPAGVGAAFAWLATRLRRTPAAGNAAATAGNAAATARP